MRPIAILLLCLVTGVPAVGHATWTGARADPGNSGLERVNTAHAVTGNHLGVVDIGSLAPGASPVTGTDGTVYVGNLAGEVIAWRADGAPVWRNQVVGTIMAAPVVSRDDGSIYVISVAKVRDHRIGQTVHRDRSFLHKFRPDGTKVFTQPFPLRFEGVPDYTSTGATSAPPNIWRHNGMERIMVPVRIEIIGGFEIRLVAFDTLGAFAGEHRILTIVHDVTGGSPITDAIGKFLQDVFECLTLQQSACSGFSLTIPGAFDKIALPMPGVAIWENDGGSPFIWVADGQHATLALKYEVGIGFFEVFRLEDRQERRSTTPVALDRTEVVAVIGTSDGRVKFEHGTGQVTGLGPILASPTRTAADRLAVVDGQAPRLLLLANNAIGAQVPLGGPSAMPAAASCTHLYVSTTRSLQTFDVASLEPVAEYPWAGDGLYPPIIGPQGHVYAPAVAGLHIFAPPPVSQPGSPVFEPVTACNRRAPPRTLPREPLVPAGN